MSSIVSDLRFSLRSFGRTPGFTSLTLLTLALGIGATVAIFSAVNEVMLRPLPFAEPDRLAMLWESNSERGWDRVHAAPANAFDWRERVSAFADVALVNDDESEVALTGLGEPIQIAAGRVTGNIFSVLGVSPLLGRTFTLEETWAGSPMRVVLSHALWRDQFGRDSTIVGSTIVMDGVTVEVIGVMGPEFRYMVNEADLWLPYHWSDELRAHIWFRQAHVVRAIARLAPGATFEQARAELAAVATQLQLEHPETNRSMEAGLTPLQSFLVGERRLTLLLLLGAVGLLQLIACANVANLLLARSVNRRQEIAVRSALGAGRIRIARQVFTESTVLAVLGTAFGLAFGLVGMELIATLRPPELPNIALNLDWRLVTFTTALTAASAVLFGTLPAIRSSRLDIAAQIADRSRTGSMSRRGALVTNGIVSVEIGLAVMLVVGAGLLVRSLEELRTVDAGVDTANVLTFEITPPAGKYPSGSSRAAFVADLLDQLRGIAGVTEAGAVRRLPYQGFAWTSDFTIDAWGPEQFGVEVRHREATPGYFATMNIPVLAGALYPARLGPEERVPVVVNRAFAEEYFRNDNPVGRLVTFDRSPDENSYWYAIVAVVGDERMSITESPRPEIISHLAGDTPRTTRVAIKTSVAPEAVVPTVRETLAALDSDIPLVRVRTMHDVAAEAVATDRFVATLLSTFAVAALLLAAVGVFGVAANAARARTREIGIRMALGASVARIVNGLITRGLTVSLLGIGLGLAGSMVSGNVMRGMLFGIEPNDPLTLGIVALLLGFVAVASGLGPAVRAARLDPVSVLNTE